MASNLLSNGPTRPAATVAATTPQKRRRVKSFLTTSASGPGGAVVDRTLPHCMRLEFGAELLDGRLEFCDLRLDLSFGICHVCLIRCLQTLELAIDVLLCRFQLVNGR